MLFHPAKVSLKVFSLLTEYTLCMYIFLRLLESLINSLIKTQKYFQLAIGSTRHLLAKVEVLPYILGEPWNMTKIVIYTVFEVGSFNYKVIF